MWQTRVQGIITGLSVFFVNNTMQEVACETAGTCDVDQQSFKAYLSRWMAASIKLAPWTSDALMPYILTSAKGAIASCTAGSDGNQCGMKWTIGANDGLMGVGEQMSALEVVQANLINAVQGPFTNSTGGTSVGNAAAGSGVDTSAIVFNTITTGDKAGAAIVTVLVLVGFFSGAWWMIQS
jgi:mannan endo-1,6-alpha-mannosidase